MMRISGYCLFATLIVTGGFQKTARADVRVPALIGDNMVLQRDRQDCIWGTADPGEQVTVDLLHQALQTVADKQGHWQVFTQPMKAGGPYELTITGKNSVVFKNILIGEVWVCSGQSNMQFALVNSQGGKDAIGDAASYPDIRLFSVTRKTSATPLDDVNGKWLENSPKTAGEFSAVGYYFGRELYRRLKVPIGLIHSSWGGTPAEAWTSHEMLASIPSLKPILDRYDASLRELPERQRDYLKAVAEWD
ncbi:MAG TPA: sialate O-acetylesterase, partial [Blastocatellia bacterium]